MGKEGIQNILRGMQANVADIDAKGEAFQRQCEEDKGRLMKAGNEALRCAVTGELIPRHEQFKRALDEIDMKIRDVSKLLALDPEKDKTIGQIEQEMDNRYVDLSSWKFARGITESTITKLSELIEELRRGIKENRLAWYNSSKRSSAKYYSVLTIDERLREEEEGDFPGRYGRDRTFPVLYLGKGFKGIEGKRPGTWKTGEDRIKVEEMITRRLGEFTEQGLIPPVSIRLYPKSSYGGDFTYLFEPPFHELRSDCCFVVAVEAECF